MIFWTRWIFRLACVLLWGSVAAHAETPVTYVPVPQELAAYVTLHTGMKLPPALRVAVVENDSAMLRYETPAMPGITTIAAGAEQDGQIYLPVKSAVHLGEESFRAILVHELTHIAQEKSGRTYACAGQREAEAYQTQNDYLLTHDMPAAMDGDSLAAMRSCTTVAQN